MRSYCATFTPSSQSIPVDNAPLSQSTASNYTLNSTCANTSLSQLTPLIVISSILYQVLLPRSIFLLGDESDAVLVVEKFQTVSRRSL